MKIIIHTSIFLSLILIPFSPRVLSQNRTYTENANELIFSFADIEKSDGTSPNNPMRFTMFFHAGNIVHYDFSEYAGLYSGWALRNIGFITEENDIKIKRRTYSIGIPIALKLGDMKNRVYVYGGGSYELFFHYKHKRFIDGEKEKQSEWFSDRTDRFAPSLFAGIQFPKGFNLRFKYYPNNFLNTDFVGRDFGEDVDYSDFAKTNLFYIALSWNFSPKNLGLDIGNSEEAKFTSFRK